MKPLFAFAAILLTSTAAQAGDSYSFDIGGRTITIEAPSDCTSTDCISVSIPGALNRAADAPERLIRVTQGGIAIALVCGAD
jgi:hypothetical protein